MLKDIALRYIDIFLLFGYFKTCALCKN